MAMAAESLCHNDPNFAVICNFWDRYGEMIGLKEISYSDLERWLEDTKQVPMPLIDIHVRLLRRIGKTSVTANRWERYIIKFCYTYSDVDAWEMEKFGYKHCKIATKLKLLKNLLEKQFDQNSTFKEKVNKLAPEDMRFQPIGRDKNGLAYWYMLDNECNLRVYREDLDDNDAETWEIVCKTRKDLAELIGRLEKQIESNTVPVDENSSNSNSVKSEHVDDEKTDDSQDSLPDVKKDPEKKEEKLDEVDGAVTNDKEKDEKKDVKSENNEIDEKKDVKSEIDNKKNAKTENSEIDEKKEVKTEKSEIGENKDEETVRSEVDKKKDVKVEDSRVDGKSDIKKEDKTENDITEKCKSEHMVKTEPLETEESTIQSENITPEECKLEGANVAEKTPSDIKCVDSQKEQMIEENKEASNEISKNSSKSQNTECTKENIPKIDDSVKDKDIISKNNLKNETWISSECLENDNIKSSNSDIPDCNKTSQDSNNSSDKSESTLDKNKSENIPDKLSENNSEENTNHSKCDNTSDKISATSNLNGAKCDSDSKSVESANLSDIKCGCDNEQEVDEKGNNQGNEKNSSVKEIDNNKSENNVRRSGRTRTARAQSQDSQLKEDKSANKSETSNKEHCENDNTEELKLNGDMEKENNKTPSKTKSKSKDKGKKRPLLFEDNSTEDSQTVEPESKKSKPAKKILTKKQPAKVKSSSEDTDDSDDIPLSQIKGTPKSSKKTPIKSPKYTPKVKGQKSEPTATRKSSRPVKKKKFDSDEEEEATSKSKKAKGKTSKNTADSEDEDTPLKSLKKSKPVEEEEEDTGGRRRSSRVKILKAQKKEPTPPPSSFSEEDEEVGEDEEHSEFSVDTELDDSDDEFNPTPKGRNAQRQAAIQDEQEAVEIPNDTPCLHCQKTDRPEWLLLCDKCDDGYHTACLRPPLMIIPDGDWFCPPCEHKRLLDRLQSSLKDLDIIMKKKDRLIKRKERLAFVGISLDNILKDEHKENVNPEYEQYSGEDEDDYYKPKPKKSFVKRSCRSRNVISYKFDDFDDMINTAIKEDLENPKPYNPGKGRSRGKDMANIYMAEGREYVSEDEGKPSPVGGSKKRKGRRLTNLDSDDPADEDSGDEFRCSDESVSEPPEEEEEDDDDVSDFSADGEGWRPRGTRRSGRRNKSSRRYKDFVVDEDEDSDFAPRRKSARATRASTRQRRKYKEVWSEEEEEELEEESEESIDTDDLCSEDSGPTKKKKNRKEIDKKVLGKSKKEKHGAKRRRVVDSEEDSESSEKSSGNSEESETKSESDDSSVNVSKIKQAAKRKLSKRRYSESSSESESSEPEKHTRRSAAKKVNYKSIAGTDSEATEVSEDKSESEKETKSKKKNVIRDDSTDTDDYYDNKSLEIEEGDTTEDDEKEPIKTKKHKKEDKEDEKEIPEKEDEKEIPEKAAPDTKESASKEPEVETVTTSKDKDTTKVQTVDKNEEDKITKPVEPIVQESEESKGEENLTSKIQSETAAQNLSMLQSNTGVIRPSPQYSKGQNLPEGNFSPQQGPQHFQGRSPPYGSPPHGQYMSSPPHQPYQAQSGNIMRPSPPHSQPYHPQAQQFPPQMMHGNFPMSTAGQQMAPMSTSQGPPPQFSQMHQRPQYSSSGSVPPNQGQMFGQSPPNQAMMRGQHPMHSEGSSMPQGVRPEMSGPTRGPFPHQQDGQMMRGPFPNQQQVMRGPYPSQQQMMMRGQYPNYPQGQMMRGPHPGQQGGHMMRVPYPNPSQQDVPRGPNTDVTEKVQSTNKQDGNIRSPDLANSQPSRLERPMMQGPYQPYHSRPMTRGTRPLQPDRPMFRGRFPTRLERPMATGQDVHFRPGFSSPDQRPQGPNPNQQMFPNRPPQPGPPGPSMSSSHVDGTKISSPPIIPQKSKDQEQDPQQPKITSSNTQSSTEKEETRTKNFNDNVASGISGVSTSKTEHEVKQEKDEDSQESNETDKKSTNNVNTDAALDSSKEIPNTEKEKENDKNQELEKITNKEEKQSAQEAGDKSDSTKSDGKTVTDILSGKGDSKEKEENMNEKTKTSDNSSQDTQPGSDKQRVPNLQSPPPQNPSEGTVIRGPIHNQQEGSIVRNPQEGGMVRTPHPYQQGMFRGQFHEMMSQMGQGGGGRMPFHQGQMEMSQRPPMQGQHNFNQMMPRPRNFMPGMRPDGMGPMQPNFQRPMYGPGPVPYSQPQRPPNSYGVRPEMGPRMPQNFGGDESRPNQSKLPEAGPPAEPTKAKKPRKPRQTKQQKEKIQAESKTIVSSSPNYPAQSFPPHPAQMGSNQQYQMPMPRPMNPQENPYMRPQFDNYGMNGINQGPSEYNQMNPGMYGPPQMMPGNRGFMIDNLLDKQPRVQQLEPIISQEEEDEPSPEQPQTYEEEPSPSNGEKDMDEMSDIGDIVKYVMNH